MSIQKRKKASFGVTLLSNVSVMHAGGTGSSSYKQRSPLQNSVAAEGSWRWWRPTSKTPKFEEPKRGRVSQFFGFFGTNGHALKHGPLLRRSASDLFDRPSGELSLA
jgi:hypothetical protein